MNNNQEPNGGTVPPFTPNAGTVPPFSPNAGSERRDGSAVLPERRDGSAVHPRTQGRFRRSPPNGANAGTVPLFTSHRRNGIISSGDAYAKNSKKTKQNKYIPCHAARNKQAGDI